MGGGGGGGRMALDWVVALGVSSRAEESWAFESSVFFQGLSGRVSGKITETR